VYALRWESARTEKKGWSPAVVGGWANAKNPVARTCLSTKEVWNRTWLERVTSVSTRCAEATNVDSLLVTSTERVGCSMHWPISTPLPPCVFLSRSSDHAQAKARTPGPSFPDLYPHHDAPAVEVPGMSVPQTGCDETGTNPDFCACSTQTQVFGRSFPKMVA